MKDQTNRSVVQSFLGSHVLATISTVNSKTFQPESALVAYAEFGNFEILFLTLKGSRKWVNLQSNNRVAMVIGWDLDPGSWETLQYEGRAFPVLASDEPKFRKIFLNKKNSPCTEEFFQTPHMKLFTIVPTWIGYSRFSGKKPRVIEIKNF